MSTTTETKSKVKSYSNYKVFLHNDSSLWDVFVIEHLMRYIPEMNERKAISVLMGAKQSGIELIFICNKEHAEAYQFILQDKGLTITIEPEEIVR